MDGGGVGCSRTGNGGGGWTTPVTAGAGGNGIVLNGIILGETFMRR